MSMRGIVDYAHLMSTYYTNILTSCTAANTHTCTHTRAFSIRGKKTEIDEKAQIETANISKTTMLL